MDKLLMSDATSTDEAPTSGFQLSEISRATKSSYQANVQIQQYLVERLAKPHHNTKFKALMIIKHVCRTGRPEFKREMGRNVEAIRECLQFKGPPDPLRGDEIYRRVRECAKEVLEALFDGQMPITTSAVAAANRIQGLGNDFTPPEQAKPSTTAYLSSLVSTISTSVMGEADNSPKYSGHPGATSNFGAPGSSGGYDSGVYNSSYSGKGGFGQQSSGGGFGNPNFSDARNETTWMQKASQLASSAASSAASAAGFGKSETSEPLQSHSSFSRPQQSGTFNRAAFSNPEGASGYSYASNRGPNAIHANSSPYSPQQAFSQQGSSTAWPSQQGDVRQQQGQYVQQQLYAQHQQQQNAFVPEMPSSGAGMGRAGGGVGDGNYEKTIIDSLCEPGGLRPVPPEDKLQEMLNTASTLSEDILGNCLLDVLNDESWQSRTKALIVIAKLVRQPDCGAHLQWWTDRADVLESLQSDPKANVRTQAFKTLRVVDPSVSAIAPASAAPAPRRTSAPAGRASFAAAAVPDNVSEMGTTITEDENQPISDADPDAHTLPLAETDQPGTDAEPDAQPVSLAEIEQPIPDPEPVAHPEMDLLGFDDDSHDHAPSAGIPGVVQFTAQVSVSPLAHDYNLSAQATPTAAAQQQTYAPAPAAEESLFAGMSLDTSAPAAASIAYAPPPAPVAFTAPVPVAPAPAPVLAPAPAPVEAASTFDFLDSVISAPQPAAPAQELDLFGSLTISQPAGPANAMPVPMAAPAPVAMASGSNKSYFDDFAGLMDTPAAPAPAPAYAPAPSGVPAGYNPAGYPPAGYPPASYMTPEQQLLSKQAAPRPPPGANAQGLYLTRPVPVPGPGPGQPAYGYGYPPRGPGGMPLAGAGRPMVPMGVAPMPGGVPMGGVPMGGVPMGGAPMGGMTPAIQLRQGASVIAPGMLSHTAERKTIPDAGNSGFKFMGGNAGNNSGKQVGAPSGGDSFSFVTDAMKAQK